MIKFLQTWAQIIQAQIELEVASSDYGNYLMVGN